MDELAVFADWLIYVAGYFSDDVKAYLREMIMNTVPEYDGFCSRCGEELLAEEVSLENESLCACCEQMRSEALQIYAEKLKNLSSKVVRQNLVEYC